MKVDGAGAAGPQHVLHGGVRGVRRAGPGEHDREVHAREVLGQLGAGGAAGAPGERGLPVAPLAGAGGIDAHVLAAGARGFPADERGERVEDAGPAHEEDFFARPEGHARHDGARDGGPIQALGLGGQVAGRRKQGQEGSEESGSGHA